MDPTTLSGNSFGRAGGRPLVVAEPMSATAKAFMELGAMVVREIAKLKMQPRNAVRCAHLDYTDLYMTPNSGGRTLRNSSLLMYWNFFLQYIYMSLKQGGHTVSTQISSAPTYGILSVIPGHVPRLCRPVNGHLWSGT